MNAGAQVNQTDVKNMTLSMSEVGPRFTLLFRRDKIADTDSFKNACKQPKLQKSETKRMNRNVYTDEFGQKRGKVFLQSQQLKTLQLRKYKKKDGKGPK